MTPYDRAWDMGSYTEYMWSYDGICQVTRRALGACKMYTFLQAPAHCVGGSGAPLIANIQRKLVVLDGLNHFKLTRMN